MSQLAGKQGQKIAADCVTIVDTPDHPQLGPGLPFDGEGVPTGVHTFGGSRRVENAVVFPYPLPSKTA